MTGQDTDVIEIDAASNTGVDNARELIANAATARCAAATRSTSSTRSTCSRREAFNALLKTMEEPPEHVKFILCTTDPHKVPRPSSRAASGSTSATSRRRSGSPSTSRRVKAEKLKAEPELLHAVARWATARCAMP
jgi:DNA polymerase-3 subunit gamma/tau